jgi:hypothetical protein
MILSSSLFDDSIRFVVLPYFISKMDFVAISRPFVDEGTTRAVITSSDGDTTLMNVFRSASERPKWFGVAEEKKDDIKDEGEGREVVQQYPWPSTPSKQLPTAQYFYQPEAPVHEDLWERVCPPVNSNKNSWWQVDHPAFEGDIGGTWTPHEDPFVVAETIVRRFTPIESVSEGTINLLAANLAESLRTYRDFCNVHILANRHHENEHHHDDATEYTDDTNDKNNNSKKLDHHNNNKHNHVRLKYRLTITRGEKGVKCPLFHYDHVPVRWIQTFVGPGVELVMDGVGVRWDAFHSFDRDIQEEDLTIDERNTLRVDADIATVYCAPQGEAVLMIGNEFDGSTTGSSSPLNQLHLQQPLSSASSSLTSSRIRPVVHKSPKVPAGRARVRFTQDIELCC